MSAEATSGLNASPGPVRILVDTSVWLDAYLGFRQGNSAARALFAAGRQAGALFLYPVGSLQDVFALLIMELKRKAREEGSTLDESTMATFRRTAWGCIDNLRENATAVGADDADVWLASKYRKVNWDLEDNMVLAAAKRAEVDYLVTSDRALMAKANVAALSLKDLAALLTSR